MEPVVSAGKVSLTVTLSAMLVLHKVKTSVRSKGEEKALVVCFRVITEYFFINSEKEEENLWIWER